MGKVTSAGRIGVAGCGAMGLPMAQNLAKAGFDVCGFDIRPAHEFGDFSSQMVVDSQDFSQSCSAVISVVRDWQQTLDLCFEDQALFSTPNYPKRLIISSTLSPRVILELRKLLPADVDLIDAPMSGASFSAEAASLTFMVGGDTDSVAQTLPLFEAMGDKIHHLGDLSTGMTCKVLNNLLAATSVVAVRRVLKDADRLGLSPAKFLEVSSQSSGGNWFGTNFDQIPWATEGYASENTIGILEKDVTCMLDAVADHPDLVDGGFEKTILDGLRALKPDVSV